jgi:uncharacterized protein (DUF169 family)
LTSAAFEPDVVVIYGNPAQVTQLVLAAEFKDGRDLTCTISGRAACVYAIVPVMQSGISGYSALSRRPSEGGGPG